MLQGEFETLTGIYPDVLLYEAAEQEYNNGDWASKAEFCECYKADEDGIATKCQKIANEQWLKKCELVGEQAAKITALADACEKLRAENSSLEDENENLRTELSGLTKRVNELASHVTEKDIRAAMQLAYQDAAHDDCKGDQILHMVWGFEYLLQRLGVE